MSVLYEVDRYGEYAVVNICGRKVTLRKIYPGTVKPEKSAPVTVNEEYWILDTPCTVGLWEAVMGSRPTQLKEIDPRLPVTCVSWYDAKAFLAEANKHLDGIVGGLPRDNEWEYAARAGTTALYSNGTDTLSPTEAAFYRRDSNPNRLVPVKSYAPNPWGLYDVHGNVWEWCEREDSNGNEHIRTLRGGSWLSDAINASSAARGWDFAFDRADEIGFRPVFR